MPGQSLALLYDLRQFSHLPTHNVSKSPWSTSRVGYEHELIGNAQKGAYHLTKQYVGTCFKYKIQVANFSQFNLNEIITASPKNIPNSATSCTAIKTGTTREGCLLHPCGPPAPGRRGLQLHNPLGPGQSGCSVNTDFLSRGSEKLRGSKHKSAAALSPVSFPMPPYSQAGE